MSNSLNHNNIVCLFGTYTPSVCPPPVHPLLLTFKAIPGSAPEYILLKVNPNLYTLRISPSMIFLTNIQKEEENPSGRGTWCIGKDTLLTRFPGSGPVMSIRSTSSSPGKLKSVVSVKLGRIFSGFYLRSGQSNIDGMTPKN